MATRSIITSGNVHLWYGKRNPATGLYFTSTQITAASVAVFDKTGATLLVATAMTYIAALNGYVYDWNPGTALSGKNVAYVVVTPTTAQPAALVPVETTLIDVSDASALLDFAAGVEPNMTVRQSLRIMLAALAGKLSGAAGPTVTIRDTNDTKNRITATTDNVGDRTAVTLDPS